MNPDRNPVFRTARQAVSGERAPGNSRKTVYQPIKNPTAESRGQTQAPSRRRVERIAVRLAPRPPQTKWKAQAKRHTTHKSLVVSSKIKAHPAKADRP
jgi:hypothetical protein